jgi:hypothetical protein
LLKQHCGSLRHFLRILLQVHSNCQCSWYRYQTAHNWVPDANNVKICCQQWLFSIKWTLNAIPIHWAGITLCQATNTTNAAQKTIQVPNG